MSTLRIFFVSFFRDDSLVLYSDSFGGKLYTVLLKGLGLSALWTSTYYAYMRAIYFERAHDVATMFASINSFVYIMSWIILHKRFIAIRVSKILVYDYDSSNHPLSK